MRQTLSYSDGYTYVCGVGTSQSLCTIRWPSTKSNLLCGSCDVAISANEDVLWSCNPFILLLAIEGVSESPHPCSMTF
jgi:hypothetical protein